MPYRRGKNVNVSNEPWFVRCSVCGFSGVDTRRDELGDGDGITLTEVTLSGATLYRPDVVGGCPFCGSKNYLVGKKGSGYG